MSIKQRKLVLVITVIYSVLILYFMFFGFGRIHSINSTEYKFNFIPGAIPLNFPTSLEYFNLWLFSFGNLAAFIPFGILIPLLYRYTFVPFISLFFASILLLELLQMLSFLGSFDINDAIVNTIGAAVGYGAYKFGFRTQSILKNLVISGIIAVALSISVLGLSHIVNVSLIKKEGDIIALHQLQEGNGQTGIAYLPFSFELGNDIITPTLNVFKREHNSAEALTYVLNGEDIILSGQYGIPDAASTSEGKILIAINGEIVDSRLVFKDSGVIGFELPLDNVNELTITLDGDVLLWDATITELNNWWN